VPARRAVELTAAPDRGMTYLSRDAAYGKLEALVAGARIAESAPVTPGAARRYFARAAKAVRGVT
jgi:hypothetical protein